MQNQDAFTLVHMLVARFAAEFRVKIPCSIQNNSSDLVVLELHIKVPSIAKRGQFLRKSGQWKWIMISGY
eukprot:6849243-Ditylum_brightwellii.AAC.1